MVGTRYWSVLACGWVEWDAVAQCERAVHSRGGDVIPVPIPVPRVAPEADVASVSFGALL